MTWQAQEYFDSQTPDIAPVDQAGDYMADWLQTMEWQHFATFTFRTPCRRPDTALRYLRRVLQRFQAKRPLRAFVAVEFHKGKDDVHLHAIIGDPDLWRKGLWESWFYKFGRCQVVPIESVGGVTGYVSKYVTKEIKDNSLWEIL